VCVCVCVNITKSDDYSISSILLSPSDDIHSVFGIVSLFCLIHCYGIHCGDWSRIDDDWRYLTETCVNDDDSLLFILCVMTMMTLYYWYSVLCHYLYSIDAIMKVFSSMMMVMMAIIIVSDTLFYCLFHWLIVLLCQYSILIFILFCNVCYYCVYWWKLLTWSYLFWLCVFYSIQWLYCVYIYSIIILWCLVWYDDDLFCDKSDHCRIHTLLLFSWPVSFIHLVLMIHRCCWCHFWWPRVLYSSDDIILYSFIRDKCYW
jgi:hypothetical protein